MLSTVTVEQRPHQRQASRESGREALDALALEQKRVLRASLAHKADAVAPEIGLTPRTLRGAMQEDTDAQLPFRRVPALLRATPDPMPLLQFWCGLVGAIAVRLPAADNRPLCDAVREFADVMQADASALADDGRYSPEEAARIEHEGLQALAAIRGYIEHVQRLAGRRCA
jgi:hypothetical protein